MEKYTILLVEDSESIRESYQTLSSVLKHNIKIVENGKKALEKIESGESIDLIITDTEMPEMNGAELLKIIKEKGYNILTIVTSGKDKEDPLVKEAIEYAQDIANSLGIYNLEVFWQKPFSLIGAEEKIEDLLSKIKK